MIIKIKFYYYRIIIIIVIIVVIIIIIIINNNNIYGLYCPGLYSLFIFPESVIKIMIKVAPCCHYRT